jgi:hypothetical protein
MNVGAGASALLDFLEFGIHDNKDPVNFGDVDGSHNHIHLVQFLHNVHKAQRHFSLLACVSAHRGHLYSHHNDLLAILYLSKFYQK